MRSYEPWPQKVSPESSLVVPLSACFAHSICASFFFLNHFLQLFLPTGSFTVDHEHFFFFSLLKASNYLYLWLIHFHALEKAVATHSSTLAWRIPETGDPGGLPSMGLHRVGHDWGDFAAAAAAWLIHSLFFSTMAHFYGFVQPVIPLLTSGFSVWFYFRFWRIGIYLMELLPTSFFTLLFHLL